MAMSESGPVCSGTSGHGRGCTDIKTSSPRPETTKRPHSGIFSPAKINTRERDQHVAELGNRVSSWSKTFTDPRLWQLVREARIPLRWRSPAGAGRELAPVVPLRPVPVVLGDVDSLVPPAVRRLLEAE
jgi:hypothetical protein